MRFVRYIAVLAVVLLAGQVHAAQLFFATSNTFATDAAATAASGINPTLTVAVGNTAHLYLWAKLKVGTTSSTSTTTREIINSLGVDLVQTAGVVAHGTTFDMTNNGARWDTPLDDVTDPDEPFTPPGPYAAGNESVGSPTISVMRRGAIGTLGLTNYTGTNVALKDTDAANRNVLADGFYELVADITIVADSAGVNVPLFLRTNTNVVAYGVGGPTTNFGAGDAGINGNTSNLASANADLFLTVTGGGDVPEPASLSMLAIGAIGLIRRRRAA